MPNVPALLEGSSGLGYPWATDLMLAEIRTSLMASRTKILTELQLHQKVVEGDATYNKHQQTG